MEDPVNTILIVGFIAKNIRGRKIVERYPEVNIFRDVYRVKSEVAILNTFSARDITAKYSII